MMRTPVIAAALIALVTLGAAASCLPIGGVACTEIGCSDTVELTFQDEQGTRVPTAHGMLTLGSRMIPFDCRKSSPVEGAVASCEGGVFRLHDVTSVPQSAAVDVTSDDGSMSFDGTATLARETFRPNGPQCDPECTTGRATVTLE